MDKSYFENIKKEIEDNFSQLSKKAEQIQIELVKAQGEYRLVNKIIADLTPKEEKVVENSTS